MQYYLFVFLILFLVFLPARAARRLRIHRIVKRRRRKGSKLMYDLIQTMLGQEVIVYVTDGSTTAVTGSLRKVEDGWIQIERSNHQIEIVSVDYISRIQEHPRSVKEKNKKK